MSIAVIPTPFVTTVPIIYGFNYTVQSFQLNTQITFNVILVDQNGTPLSVSQVSLSGDAYNAWGNNDAYIETYICNTLGLTPLNPIVNTSTSTSTPTLTIVDNNTIPSIPIDTTTSEPTDTIPSIPIDTTISEPTDTIPSIPIDTTTSEPTDI